MPCGVRVAPTGLSRDRTPGRGTGKEKGKGKGRGKGRRNDNPGDGWSWGGRKTRQGDDRAVTPGLTTGQQKMVDWALQHATKMAKENKCLWYKGDHHPAQCPFHVSKNVGCAQQAQVETPEGKPAGDTPKGDAQGDTAAKPAASSAPIQTSGVAYEMGAPRL